MNKLAVFFALFAFASLSQASALIDQPLPSNAYITINGYDIAWASPCAADPSNTCSPIDLSYQSQFGWAVMTSTLFAQLGITATDFEFAGANVSYATNSDSVSGAYVSAFGATPPTGDVAVAASYFNGYNWIDWQDGFNGQWSFADNNGQGWYDTLVYRVDNSNGNSNVPEPASIALIGLGLAGLIGSRRKAKQA